MTSLFGRMLPLFVGVRRVEDLFTEAVARIFELRNDLCLGWLEEIGAISQLEEAGYRSVRVSTQKSFVAMEDHDSGSRPDLIIEVSSFSEDEGAEPIAEVVMFESKIGSFEGQDQLRRYAGHLGNLSAHRKTLVYITRAYDPKDYAFIESAAEDVKFLQLRWHDFYKYLQNVEKDSLIEELMLFMEEQGMSRSHRLSTTDLMALSGVPRAFEIFDEVLGDEVQETLKNFTGSNIRPKSQSIDQVRNHGRYVILSPLRGEGRLLCFLGFNLNSSGYPGVGVNLESSPNWAGKPLAIQAMKQIKRNKDWYSYGINDLSTWSGVFRNRSLPSFLHEEDHIAAIKRFFIESIHQLRDELTEFKRENPDLPWNGGS